MRNLYVLVCVLGLTVGIAAGQHGAKQSSPRYEPASVISVVEAVYPLQSVSSGTVVLELSLDDAGKITNIRVVSGIASLTEPSERSVRQWKFQSAKLDGMAIPSKIVVAFSFVPPNVGPRM